jgi:hypothetical protein
LPITKASGSNRWGDWLDARGFSNSWSEVDYSVLSVADICTIFIAVNRGERFCDGSIGNFFEEWHMLQCLKVLERRIKETGREHSCDDRENKGDDK